MEGFIKSNSGKANWRKSQFAKGVWVKDLGLMNGLEVQLVRFEPGSEFPPHNHAGCEIIYMLEGDAIQNGERLTAGCSSIAPKGSEDREFRSENGCEFLLVSQIS